MAMTSRDRVRAVLNHEIPDRVPNGLGGHESGGLHALAYNKFRHVLGLEPRLTRMKSFLGDAVFEEDVMAAMEGDVLLISAMKLCTSDLRGDVADQWKEHTLWGTKFLIPKDLKIRENQDGSYTWLGEGWFDGLVCPKGAYYFDRVDPTNLFTDFVVPDPDDYKPSGTFTEEALRKLERTAKRLYEETDYSLSIGEGITTLQVEPGGFANCMVLLMEEPEVMQEILDNYVEAALSQVRLLDQAVGNYVDLISIVQDIGDNRGVMIGAPLWREVYKPAYDKMFKGIRKLTRMKVNFHSCGSVEEILPDLIECGMEILNPIQTSAANMSPAHLKALYGKDVIFWGGAYDAQLVSHSASYEEVYRVVCDNIKVLAEGGNYIFSGVHNLPADIPEYHLKAIFDAYRDTRAN